MNKSAEELFLIKALHDNNISPTIEEWHKILEKDKVGYKKIYCYGNNENGIRISFEKDYEEKCSSLNIDKTFEHISNLDEKVGTIKELFGRVVYQSISNEIHYQLETNKNIKEDFPEIVESFNSSLNDIFKGKINELSVKNVLDLLKDKDISIITDLITDDEVLYKNPDVTLYGFDTCFGDAKFFEPCLSENLGIKYDTENFSIRLICDEKTGIPLLEASVGGDWEVELIFIFYFDKEKDQFDFFFDYGNDDIYDVKNKIAYGNEVEGYEDYHEEQTNRIYSSENQKEIRKNIINHFFETLSNKYNQNKLKIKR